MKKESCPKASATAPYPLSYYVPPPPRSARTFFTTKIQTQLIDKPIIDRNRYQSSMNIDFRYQSIEIDKEKS